MRIALGTPCRRCGTKLAGSRSALPEGHALHHQRGLCSSCVTRSRGDGTLLDYPRLTWSAEETLATWDELRRFGRTRAEAAAEMGVTVDALDRAILRARDRGDPRAVWAAKTRDEHGARMAEFAAKRWRRRAA